MPERIRITDSNRIIVSCAQLLEICTYKYTAQAKKKIALKSKAKQWLARHSGKSIDGTLSSACVRQSNDLNEFNSLFLCVSHCQTRMENDVNSEDVRSFVRFVFFHRSRLCDTHFD